MSGAFKEMQREFSSMPFRPEYTPGGPTQATVRTVAPATQVKVEDAQKGFQQNLQSMQIQAIVGQSGENLGPGKMKTVKTTQRQAGINASKKLRDQADREFAIATLERLNQQEAKEKELKKKRNKKKAGKEKNVLTSAILEQISMQGKQSKIVKPNSQQST